MIALLAPFFAGPLRPFGERLTIATQPAQPSASAAALDHSWADACLASLAQALGCNDRRALAAAWFRDYTLAVLPGALVAATLHRRSLPFDHPALGWQVAADGRLARLLLPDDGTPAAATLPRLLSPLLARHLPQVVAAFAVAARVSPRLLWCTGGVAAAGIARQLAAHPGLAAAQKEEVLAWSGNAVSADGFGNPFHGAFRPGAEPWLPGVAAVRRICCLNHRLPGEGYCGTCPLVADARARARLSGAQTAPARATAATATPR
ncbi:siderophore-iron reductase FhuF [Cupriavidus alkaliphilus]|uniref:siderophore-iron reductase FhuF n=1 Tax=Cupriavidus alkaliphilus TaxID=942866 RepID=UPI0008160914|nr:siderophore-iron reductase FhuF [Cupriavidus alkaliphilus]SCB31176.1 ferric iron reductase protein FhuF [Cupriavidus alkaliphilus]